MAKLTKKQLKGILKECLKEILQEEGLLLSEASNVQTRRVPVPDMVSSTNKPTEETASEITNPRLQEHVDALADTLSVHNKSDGEMFKSIFADTAKNTLQKQQAAGHSVGAAAGGAAVAGDVGNLLTEDPSSTMVSSHERSQLEELSHEGDIGRWAAVCFAGKQGN